MPDKSPAHVQSSEAIDIFGIGVSVWDSIMLVDVYPAPGSVVQAARRIEGIGGGIAVAVSTAARLGSRTALVDSLGDDDASTRIVESLRHGGVDTRYLLRNAGESSSVASIWSDAKTAERTIIFSPGSACELLQWNPEFEPAIARSKILHLNGRHPDVCMRAIKIAKDSDVKVSFDGGAHRHREAVLPMLAAADIVIVARQFAEAHYFQRRGADRKLDSMKLAEFLVDDLRCELAAVTDGASGSFLVPRGEVPFHEPAVSPELAVDTTGCGDTYHGAFLHALAQGDSVRDAAAFAAKIASANARSIGALAFPETYAADW